MTAAAVGFANAYPLPRRRIRWLGLIFFVFLHVVGIVGTPLYLYHHGVTAPELALLFFYLGATGLATTIGYHRLFAHGSFKASPDRVASCLLFFGAATFEESALKWSSQHRQHHLFTDTEHDPYGVNRGFWHAHIGWILFWRHTHQLRQREGFATVDAGRASARSSCMVVGWRGRRPAHAHRLGDRPPAGRIHHGRCACASSSSCIRPSS